MRNFTVILVSVFLLVLGSNTNVSAQSETEMDIDIFRVAYSSGVTYGIEFEIVGSDVQGVLLRVPNGGNRMFLRNTLGFNEFVLETSGMNHEEFVDRFPEGEYSIILTGHPQGSLSVNMTHDFPDIPTITFPEDGDIDVPLTPTIVWDSLVCNRAIILEVEGDNGVFSFDLPTSATSMTIPSGILQSGAEYELSLQAGNTISGENETLSIRTINFTTE